jgi:hypothetical protein
MENFLKSNPGLKSRIGNYFHFEDFTPDELHAIAIKSAIDRHIVLTEEANHYLAEQLMEGFRNRDRTFGNARYAISLIRGGQDEPRSADDETRRHQRRKQGGPIHDRERGHRTSIQTAG